MKPPEALKACMHRRPSGRWMSTRTTLLERLRNLEDQDAWFEFFSIYRKLIYSLAHKAQLSEEDAEDVVQETLIGVARRMETFRNEPERCSFKGWLMHLTRRRIADCFRKQRAQAPWLESMPWETSSDDSPTETFPDLVAEQAFENLWTEEWHQQLLEAADSRVRRHLKPVHYQVYYLHVVKGRPVLEVSQALGVGVLSAHVICHRVVRKMRREVQRLETGFR